LAMPVEVVSVQVAVEAPALALPRVASADPLAARRFAPRRVAGHPRPAPVVVRDALDPGAPLSGPALVVDSHATTWVAPGWSARRDAHGHLALVRHRS